jgi:hypothetical protein
MTTRSSSAMSSRDRYRTTLEALDVLAISSPPIPEVERRPHLAACKPCLGRQLWNLGPDGSNQVRIHLVGG